MVVRTTIYYGLQFIGIHVVSAALREDIQLGIHLPLPSLGSFESMRKTFSYISIIILLSITNVIGGIDVTESA